jgi:uncharacterized membrane protein
MTEGNRPDQATQATQVTQVTEGLPTERLAQEAKNLLEAFAQKALAAVGQKVTETTRGLLEKAQSADGGGPGVQAAVSGVQALTEGKSPLRAALGAGATGLKEGLKGKIKQLFKGGGKGKKGLKFTTIIETVDVGVPLRLAYNQWTQFEDYPTFMKKVEHVERPSEEKTNWKAQVFWSHRNWEATVIEQVPDDHIIWRSKGAKGYVDGSVSFSELAPNLTRICLVMEYHPQGFFERTGNLWRAPGRRTRLEFKHFRRHLMTHAILEPDEIEGWRGEIRDSEVVKTHEEAMEQEEREREEEPERGRRTAEEEAQAREEERPEEEPKGEGIEAEQEEGFAEEGEEEEGEEEEEGGEEEGEKGEFEEGEEPAEEEEPVEAAKQQKPGAGEQDTGAEEEPAEPRRPARRSTRDEGEEAPRRPARRGSGEGDGEAPRRPARRRTGEGDGEEERPRRPVRRHQPSDADR